MRDFNLARVRLSEFMRQQAASLFQTYGETFVAVPTGAPDTYEGVAEEYRMFVQHGRAFRVDSANCEGAIYTSPVPNHAFRFWHDVLHAQFHFDFSHEGEMAVASVHLAAARAAFGAGSPEVRLLTIDVVGQLDHFQMFGEHVHHQLAFARGMWVAGAYSDVNAKMMVRMITYAVEPHNGSYRVARRVAGQPIMYRASHSGNILTYNFSAARDIVAYLEEDRQAQQAMHWREA